MKWVAAILASLLPILAGVAIGTLGDPFAIEMSKIKIAIQWMAVSLANAAPIGFAIWLSWRFPLSNNRWRKLVLIGAILAPASLLTTTMTHRVSCFTHYRMIEFLDPSISLFRGDNILDEAMPDVLFFIMLVLVLSIARPILKLPLASPGDSTKASTRLSIQSMLAVTLMASLLFLAISHELKLNYQELIEMKSPYETFSFMDVLGIVTPLSSAVAAGIATCLLTWVNSKKLCRSGVLIAFAISILHLPAVLRNQSLHWIHFAPETLSILPHGFDVLGALSTFLVCAACLTTFHWTGARRRFVRFEFPRVAARRIVPDGDESVPFICSGTKQVKRTFHVPTGESLTGDTTYR